MIPVLNPKEFGKVALFGWGGKPYEIPSGETVLLEDHLAGHARKHNPWLVVLDESVGALSYAESQVRLAKDKVENLSRELAAKTAELKKAQVELLNSQNKLKSEEQRQKAELEASTK